MIYSGSAISVQALENGIAELKFDLAGESVNKFNAVTVNELAAATQAIKADSSIKGVVVTSGKGVFIVGADITEFGSLFANGEAGVVEWTAKAASVFSAFEDLTVPSVVAINGIALGGGLRNVPVLRLPRDVHCRQGRSAGSKARPDPRLRRHGSPQPSHRYRQCR